MAMTVNLLVFKLIFKLNIFLQPTVKLHFFKVVALRNSVPKREEVEKNMERVKNENNPIKTQCVASRQMRVREKKILRIILLMK